MPVEKIYRGLPPPTPSPEPLVVKSAAQLDWRFLVAFFVIFVCFIFILIVVTCIRRRRRQQTPPVVDEEVRLVFLVTFTIGVAR